MPNPVEVWKAEKHGLDVWPDVLRFAAERTPMKQIDTPDLERMKWHGVFYRKRDTPGSYMLRIRLTGCELSAEQAKAIAYVAYEYGYSIVDVTTRANIQVQGLSIENVPAAIERLNAVGLTAKQTGHDNIRNVFGHPFSGVDPDELIDTRDLCREITELFLDNRVYSDLPRKMNIAVNGRAQHGAHYWSQDISYLACRTPEGEVMFQVLIGGTQGQNPKLGRHLPVLVAPEQIVAVTAALLDLFREKGSREKRDQARLRFLVERIGIHGVLDWLEGRLDFPLRPCVAEPAPPTGYDELVGWFRQKDEHDTSPRAAARGLEGTSRTQTLWTMGLCVPLGRLAWQQLEALALASRKWGSGRLRATHEQGIALLDIPAGFKDAAATDAAACGLSLHADSLTLNTVACTGKQFCNIAVTDTKGHMFQLIERLRQRALALHGIRIHMSGCPSSCAQHFTADIGLKGVRVRRLLGTREGFDVYLAGGLSGQVHLGVPYRLGVDVDQLPQLIEDVVKEYYLRRRAGQTFSAYWREKLHESEAAKVGDGEYTPPVWLCEGCEYRHLGEDPPVYCPKCAGLRRHFARLEEGAQPLKKEADAPAAPPRSDGFAFAAKDEALSDAEGLTVEVAGKEYALFRVNGKVHAIDSACPHEGAPLAQGEMVDGVVTCPWHGWTFNACTGCSLSPAGNDVRSYETKVEDGNIYLRVAADGEEAKQVGASDDEEVTKSVRKKDVDAPPLRGASPKLVTLPVLDVIDETPDTKTFRLDNRAGGLPVFRAGQFVKLCVPLDGREMWRSFTISSSPARPDTVELTVKRNPAGEVSNYLHDEVTPGGILKLKGPQGGFFFNPERHAEPLVLISAGSGITPMMSILRYLADTNSPLSCRFIHGARTELDVIFAEECERLAEAMPNVEYSVTLTQPSPDRPGFRGRIDFAHVEQLVENLADCRYFLCGPNDFMASLRAGLQQAGVPADRIHTEQFHATKAPMKA